jgi:serine/threonine protein kinase
MTLEDPVVFDSAQWKNCSAHSKDLITKLLMKRPEERITLDKVLMHPWFN